MPESGRLGHEIDRLRGELSKVRDHGVIKGEALDRAQAEIARLTRVIDHRDTALVTARRDAAAATYDGAADEARAGTRPVPGSPQPARRSSGEGPVLVGHPGGGPMHPIDSPEGRAILAGQTVTVEPADTTGTDTLVAPETDPQPAEGGGDDEQG